MRRRPLATGAVVLMTTAALALVPSTAALADSTMGPMGSGPGSGTISLRATDLLYSPSNLGVMGEMTSSDALDELLHKGCPRLAALPKVPARAAVIAQAWAAVAAVSTSRSAARSLAAVRKTKGVVALARIPNAVIAGVTLRSPRVALAASIRGAELEPANQRHYVNAATLLIGYGRLREANGMLSLAAKLRLPTGTPFGIPAVAALRNAQGELALATGRFVAAESLFRSAAKAAPVLAEARLGVAHALKCRGQRTAAVRWKIRGERRKDGTVPGDRVNPQPSVMVEDLGDAGGIPGTELASFGSYKRPANAAEGAALAEEFRTIHQDALDRGLALNAQQNAISLPYGNRSLGRWIEYVNERWRNDPQIAAFRAQQTALTAEWNNLTGLIESRPSCYYTNQHDVLFDFHRRHFEASAAYAQYFHRLYTSLAAQVGNPAYSRYLNLEADHMAATLYGGVVQLISYTTRTERQEGADGPPPTPDYPNPCYRGQPTGAGAGENKAEDASPKTEPCSAAKAIRTKVKLGSVVSAEFSCEGGKVEAVPAKWGIDQAYVGLFGEAGVKWKNGDVTAVAGVKTAVSTDGITGLPTAGVSGKVGMYVTAGKGKGLPEFGGGSKDSYTVKDYGIRIQGTAEIPVGKAGAFTTITKFDDKTDISLVGVFSGEN